MDMNLFVACLSAAAFTGFFIGCVVGIADQDRIQVEPTEDGSNPL